MLQVRNLSKVFYKDTPNENSVFRNLSLDIEDEEFVTVIGSNGAGKSTLLNLIAGSIEADDGSILLEDVDVSKLPQYKRTRFIGRVFQSPAMGTSPSMTILENLSMAFNKGKKFNLTPGVSRKNVGRFKEMLKSLSLGLEDRLEDKVGLLSGGQRQALSLLMATMCSPKLLLLDEHTAALDPKTSEVVTELTGNIISDSRITTVMVTHNLNHAISMGSRLIMLHRGSVVLDIKGEEKRNLTVEKLLGCFDKIQAKNFISDRLLFS